MKRAVVVIVGLALAGFACHASDSSPSTADAGSGAPTQASLVTPHPGPPGGTVDVCAALSAADMAQASGRPVVVAETSARSECTYRSNENVRLEYIVRVGVLHGIHVGGSKQDAVKYMQIARATDSVRRFAPAVDVAGLGDEATLVTYAERQTPKDVDAITVLARKGDSIVELIHARGATPEAVAETARKALPKVLSLL